MQRIEGRQRRGKVEIVGKNIQNWPKNHFFDANDYIFGKRLCILSKKMLSLHTYYNKVRDMETKDLNRIKVVLADKKRTNKWLAEQLGKDPATVSKWCTNSAQPNLENLMDIAKCLEVDLNELVRM